MSNRPRYDLSVFNAASNVAITKSVSNLRTYIYQPMKIGPGHSGQTSGESVFTINPLNARAASSTDAYMTNESSCSLASHIFTKTTVKSGLRQDSKRRAQISRRIGVQSGQDHFPSLKSAEFVCMAISMGKVMYFMQLFRSDIPILPKRFRGNLRHLRIFTSYTKLK